jgi:hypothetical protein
MLHNRMADTAEEFADPGKATAAKNDKIAIVFFGKTQQHVGNILPTQTMQFYRFRRGDFVA